MKTLRTLLLILLPVTALAVTYRVDSEGGPEGLAAAVIEAFAAWQGLDETLEVSESEDALTVFRYSDVALLGDDTLSLTVQRQNGERSIDILVTPTLSPAATNALLHETGLLLDLAVSDSGVMSPALPAEPLTLGETETLALSTVTAVKEDVNRDGVVDFYDLVDFAKSFGQPGINMPADINDDGLVDRQDLDLLRAAYTFTPPSSTGPAQPTEQQDGEASEDPDFEGLDGEDGNGLEPAPAEPAEEPQAEDTLPSTDDKDSQTPPDGESDE